MVEKGNRLNISEEKYRSIILNIPDVIWTADVKGNTIFISDNVIKIFGFTPDEMYEGGVELWFSRIHAEDIDKVNESYKNLFEKGEKFDIEYRVKRKDGVWIWLHDRAIKSYKRNKLEYADGIASDITQQKLFNEKLKESECQLKELNEKLEQKVEERTKALKELEEQYEMTINFFTDPLHVVDKDLRIILANFAFNDFLHKIGIKPDICGKTVFEAFPFLLDKVRSEYSYVFDTQKTLFTEETYIIKGNEIVTETRKIPIIKDGLVDQVITVIRDITINKTNEKKIKESEENYRELVDNANSIILKWDKSGKVIFINEYGERFFGYSNNELIGNNVVGTIVPKTESSGRDLEELMRNICTNPDNYDKNENENVTKDGTKVWISWTNKAILDDRKNLIGILSIGNDITERKKAEEELKVSNTTIEIINKVIRKCSEETDLNRGLKDILELTLNLTKFQSGGIYLIDKQKKIANLIYQKNLSKNIINDANTILIKEGDFKAVLLDRKTIFADDFAKINAINASKWELASIACIPIVSKEELFGSLNLGKIEQHKFLESEKELLISIGKEIGTMISKITAQEQLKESTRKFEILNQVIRKCIEEMNLDRGIKNILDLTLNLTKFYGGCIYIVDKDKGTASIVYSQNFPKDLVEDIKVVAIDKGVYRQIFLDGKSIFADNYAEINPERALRWGIASIACVPVFSDDKIVGSLNIALKEKYEFSDIDKEILSSICREIGAMIARLSAQEQLKESEQKYRHLFNQSPYSIVLMDLEGTILEFNRTLEITFGNIKEEILRKNFLQHANLSLEQISSLKERLKAITDGKEEAPFELQIVKKDGIKLWVNVRSSLIELGDQQYILTMIQDINEKKESEQKIKESEEKFRTITEQSFTGIFIMQQGLIKYANQELSNITGYSNEELLSWRGQDALHIVHADDLDKLSETFQKNSEGNPIPVKTNTFRLIHKNKTITWIDSFSKRINYEGKPATFTTMVDITEKKESERKLCESEEKYRLILENANDLITIINDKFIHEYINENAFFNALGYTKEDIIGKSPLTPLHPDDQIVALKLLKEGFEKGEARVEMRLRHKNGTYYWYEHKGKRFIDIDGKVKAIIFARDITERKNAEEMVRKEIEKLKELDKIKTEFVYRASHELKTPLNLICSSSELLSKYYSDLLDDRASSLINIINIGGLRLKNLVNQLLDVSRIEIDKMELTKQQDCIVDILMDCVNSINFLIKERNLNLFFDIKYDFILDVDRMRIEQVFFNILTNAIKNTPPKGNITINVKPANNYLDIQIQDTGIGLTKEEIPLLFQKFGKIERYGKGLEIDTEGSGLGLYISKEIVELHGGKILVQSEGRDKGSTFIIRLPIP